MVPSVKEELSEKQSWLKAKIYLPITNILGWLCPAHINILFAITATHAPNQPPLILWFVPLQFLSHKFATPYPPKTCIKQPSLHYHQSSMPKPPVAMHTNLLPGSKQDYLLLLLHNHFYWDVSLVVWYLDENHTIWLRNVEDIIQHISP